MDELLRSIFAQAKAVNEQDLIKKQTTANIRQQQQQLTKARAEHGKVVRDLSKWEDLKLDSSEGNCLFTPEQVKNRWILPSRK